MRPASRSFRADIAHNVAGNPILASKIIEKPTTPRAGANVGNVRFSEDGIARQRPPRWIERVVQLRIGHVFRPSGPSQIGLDVIGPPSVTMGDFVPFRRPRAMERLANQGMNFDAKPCSFVRDMKRRIAVSIDVMFKDMACSRALAGRCPTHAAKIRNFIVRREADRFPMFHAVDYGVPNVRQQVIISQIFERGLRAGGVA